MRYRTLSSCCTPFLLIALFVIMGCSNSFDPMAPDLSQDETWQYGDLPLDGPFGERSNRTFLEVLNASMHENYTTISGQINGATGGSFSGTVSGYQNAFSLDVPAGAFQGFSTLQILVPNEGVPVYQLLPHCTFDEGVEVTLDYYKWIVEGEIEHGDCCEVFFMDEENEEFVALSPPVIFVANSSASTVTFTTDHFSRWTLIRDDD